MGATVPNSAKPTRTIRLPLLPLGALLFAILPGCPSPTLLDVCTQAESEAFCDPVLCPENLAFDVRCAEQLGPCEDPGGELYCETSLCPENTEAPACANPDACLTEPGSPTCCSTFPAHPSCITPINATESCLECHAAGGDYGSPNAIEHPHPWQDLACTDCHAGDPQGNGKEGSHVPTPPRLSDQEIAGGGTVDFWGEFNRRTLTNIDKLPDYTVDGKTYAGLDWLQFINPGDLRVVTENRGCGRNGCHAGKADAVASSIIATSTGVFSGARFSVGTPNAFPERAGVDGDTLADIGPRTIEAANYNPANRKIGEVESIEEVPEYVGRTFYDEGRFLQYTAAAVNTSRYDGNVLDPEYDGKIASDLAAHLLDATTTQQCGDCHLYSAGANNRYADFRASGCTACHFEYGYDGRSRSSDPNVNKVEPVNPDAIAPGERSHPRDHRIRNIAKNVNGVNIGGISDRSCVGCHQGSNRTVLQFWGYRVDPNRDLIQGRPNPYTPVNFTTATSADPASRAAPLADLSVGNQTFNGLEVATQIIATEDYDGDGLDDTPPDIHHERGMVCIDCHGSHDLHGDGRMVSRLDQQVAVRCESCHGTVDAEATVDADNYAVDGNGRRLTNLQRDASGAYWLRSRGSGNLHWVVQVRDVVSDTGKVNPRRQVPVYNPLASFAMGRIDDDPGNGLGPLQQDPRLMRQGFSHSGDVDGKGGLACATCHSGWQNNCVGCHLDLSYDGNPQDYDFSNVTGEQIFTELDATFRLVNPVDQFVGVSSRGLIEWMQPETKMFFTWTDHLGDTSEVLTFSDRKGYGSNTTAFVRQDNQALGFNQMTPHSTRGKLRPFAAKTDDELRYYGLGATKDCVGCHLADGADQNGNAVVTVDDPRAVSRVAKVLGLGDTFQPGRYLFDEFGEPIINGEGDPDRAAYQLDRVVDPATGKSFASNLHPRLDDRSKLPRTDRPEMAGPLGAELISKMQTQIILDTVYQR